MGKKVKRGCLMHRGEMSFGATVCKTLRRMLSDHCLSCLSVMFVYFGQTATWIKIKLGTQLGLGPSHIVLDGDPAPPPQKGAEPPIFGPFLLWPNVWMHQDATWYGSRPRPRRLSVKWGSSSPAPKKGTAPNFWPMFIVAKQLYVSRYNLVRT